MGKIDKILSKTELPDRDDHNCRVFVDCAENVHFHYREHRIVFSVNEFMQFAQAIIDGVKNLNLEILNGYKESPDLKEAPTKILGGSQTESLVAMNDPKKSAYFNNEMQIEKQVDGYGDVIHFHYRDYRAVFRKYETWKRFCECVAEAWKNTKKEFFKE